MSRRAFTMCGIVGVLNLKDGPAVDLEALRQMLEMIRHRGPDEFGLYRDSRAGLGSARLSIIDLVGGSQPICNEDGRLWIVFNGEIFNYLELRSELEAGGHRFSTRTDTEVIIHLYEDRGPECLHRLNGQFAVAIWDERRSELFLARDRLGIRPLFYTVHEGRLLFGSEVKAILAYPGMRAAIDPESLAQVFTFWSTLAPRTAFRGIYEIPPAHYLLIRQGRLHVRRYWALDFAAEPESRRDAGEYMEEFVRLLTDATRIRLRADVCVGAYLSGGLDSSLIAALSQKQAGSRLETFSISFENRDFDESAYQHRAAEFLGTDHHVIRCTHGEIARSFPDVIWHTEVPILRTAPAPLFLLSRLVRDHRLKVVLTGEGADEILGGYDIFKEMKIRRFWSRNPDSKCRPLLLRRLYPDIARLGDTSQAFLFAFFKRDLDDTDNPFYSHWIRWSNSERNCRFLLAGDGWFPASAESIPLPEGFRRWPPLGRAMYLEAAIFLPEYLLSSQGDRMTMAHSVEGRYPFLDYRVVECACSMPPSLKMRGLTEKWLLRQIGRRFLPEEIWRRPKRPYRAPVHKSFFPDTPEYLDELLCERALQESRLFKPEAVGQLVRKARNGASMSEVEDMALAGVLSTQLLHHLFVRRFALRRPDASQQVRIVDHAGSMSA